MGDKRPFLARLVGSPKEEEKKPESSEGILEQGKILDSKKEQIQYNLIIESMQAGVEASYYWIQRFITSKNPSFGLQMKLKKVRDIFTSSPASSFWGSIEQRKGLQQDKVSQYLATIGKLIKDMFQIIRELRIIDERLEYYDGYNKRGKHNEPLDEASCVTLKGTWIDLVEGGAKNPASVYGLAQQVGFAILPDLFFTVHPATSKDVDKETNKLKKIVNRKVLEVLKRKLNQFLVWKEKTEAEIRQRRIFVLKYLRMHFNNVKLYSSWIKPYLKAIKALQSGFTEDAPEVSASFETNLVELELIGYNEEYITTTEDGYEEEHKFRKYFPCVLVKFKYVAMPSMSYQKEYQRGPIHLGRTEIIIEPLILTKKQMDEYKIAIERKDLEEVEDLIPSLEGSLKSLGPELDKYLEQAGEAIKKQEEKKPEESELTVKGVLSPFTNVFKGLKEIFTFGKKPKEEGEISKKIAEQEKDEASNIAKRKADVIYDIYKKSHGMLAP